MSFPRSYREDLCHRKLPSWLCSEPLRLRSSLTSKTLSRNTHLACKAAEFGRSNGQCSLVDSNSSRDVSGIASWLLPAHWRQTQTWMCNQKPGGGLVTSQMCLLQDPAPPGLPCVRVRYSLGLMQQEPAFQHTPVVWLFGQFLFSGTAGLFLAGAENDHISKVVLGCSVMLVYREVHTCLCPQNNLDLNSPQLFCSQLWATFPRLLFIWALPAQIFCLQEICLRATLSITFFLIFLASSP